MDLNTIKKIDAVTDQLEFLYKYQQTLADLMGDNIRAAELKITYKRNKTKTATFPFKLSYLDNFFNAEINRIATKIEQAETKLQQIVDDSASTS